MGAVAAESGTGLQTVEGRLIYARERAGLSQGEAANKIGVSRNTISRYENGRAPKSVFTLERLAEAYGVTLSWLQVGRVEDHAQPGNSTGSTDAEREAPADLRPGRYYLVCPACNRTGLKPDALWRHLRAAGECVADHSLADASALFSQAERDPGPWVRMIEQRKAEIRLAEHNRQSLKGDSRRSYDAAIRIMKASLAALERQGHERYEIPSHEPY